LQKARELAKTTVCLTNLRQAGIVFQYYFDMSMSIFLRRRGGLNLRMWIRGFGLASLDAELVAEGTGVNVGYPEVIGLNPGTYPAGIWRCPSARRLPSGG
jgi:hypothetical protein